MKNGTQWMYKGRTLSALQFQSFFPQKCIMQYQSFQDPQTVSSFLRLQHHLCRAHQRSLQFKRAEPYGQHTL